MLHKVFVIIFVSILYQILLLKISYLFIQMNKVTNLTGRKTEIVKSKSSFYVLQR